MCLDATATREMTMNSRYNLLSSASLFDLHNVEDRRLSHKFLVDLFCDLQTFIRPKTFIEFGAFDAGFSRRIRPLHPLSKVIAFEANPYNYKHFREGIDFQAENIEYHHLAISNKNNSTISFQIQRKRSGADASPIKGDDSLLKRNVSDPHEAYRDIEYETVSVDTVTLDSFFRPTVFGLDDFSAWIDVEGALEQALSGGVKTLSATRSLLVEIEEKPFWSGQWTGSDVEQFFSQMGFEPIARDFEFEHQYNVIFIKPEVKEHFGFNQMMVKYYERIGNKRA